MEIHDKTLNASAAEKDFDLAIYGQAGRVAVVFPEGDATCTSWENAGMFAGIEELIDRGSCMVVATDALDDESWYFHAATPEYRLQNVASYFDYVENELYKFVTSVATTDEAPLLVGVGMGALNATIAMLRYPERYSGLLAVSGTYDVHAFIEGELDEAWLAYSPVDLVASLDSAALKRLKDVQLAFVCGTNATETGIATQRALEDALVACGVDATFEYWGPDVTHGWTWWKEEVAQLLPCLLTPQGLVQRRFDAQIAAAQGQYEHARADLCQLQDSLSAAKTSLQETKRAVEDHKVRLAKETRSLKERAAREAELALRAQEAWAQRDEAAKALAEASERGRVAQEAADAARDKRAESEWIAGEIRAQLQTSEEDQVALAQRVKELDAARAQAKAELQRLQKEIQELEAAAGGK
ncbi:MAG: alpha/beta hydrolase-fold protein [Atopobiaceae bacterium]|jgi:esterase/lipase superfamily enzyme